MESIYRRRSEWKCATCVGRSSKATTASDAPSTPTENKFNAPALPTVNPNEITNLQVYNMLLDMKNDNNSKLRKIENELSELRHSVQHMSLVYDDVLNELKSIKTESASLKKELRVLQSENREQKQQIESLTTSIYNLEQYTRCRNLEINGVRETVGEDVLQIAVDLASEIDLNITKEDIEVGHRIPSSKGPKPIVIQFKERRKRDAFALKRSLAITNDKIKGTKIGERVYFNEHLSPYFKSLLRLAKLRARENSWNFVWFKNGKLFCRKDEGTQIHRIQTEQDITKFIVARSTNTSS